ncbi:hypothetical protein KA107_03040 [Candidatus Pacearchaeota archaeon]|nr:hypothetical protein [Candidatus Pacearchaeota archaeon]
MERYNARDLKGIFGELVDSNDYILAPLIDSAFSGWMKGLPNKEITDARLVSESRYGVRYALVSGGKLVSIQTVYVDIDAEDPDESIMVTNAVNFDGEDTLCRVVKKSLDDFVKEKGLPDLKELARADLKKVKTYHLGREMYDFYFPKSS